MDSKKYNNQKLGLGIAEGILSFLLTLVFVYSGLSLKLENYLSAFTEEKYFIFTLFVISGTLTFGILIFPLSYIKDFYLEHKFGLSNQTFLKWILEDIKSLAVSLVIGIPILLAFYFIMNKYQGMWWLPFAILLFFVSVILARVVPVFILPLFYKVTPIDDEDLIGRIKNLAKDAGINVENVYRFNMSKNTKKANAAFTGIGKSKRILLGDTLLDNFSNDEIETVIAHELGHYKKKHIIKNLIIGTASSFITLFLISFLYEISLHWFGFAAITTIAALPLLALWMMLVSLLTSPFTNILSRKFEYEADEYAVTSTLKADAFILTLKKLTEQNLGDKEPHPFVEWFFYSHPSIKNRTAAINKFVKNSDLFSGNTSGPEVIFGSNN